MTSKAIYAGSFDPPTNGHLWMIQQAAHLFNEVVVAVGINPLKKSTFSTDTRLAMLQDITKNLSNVTVDAFGSRYLVDYAADVGANYLLRGIRNSDDTAFEAVLRQVNADITRRTNPDATMESVFLMPPRELIEVSSSMVKALVGPDGWERTVAAYVPAPVLARLIGNEHHWLWEELVRAGASGDENTFWQMGLMPYAEFGRHHHSMPHVSEVLNELRKARHMLENPAMVGFAAICHDAILDCSQSNNEERSAVFARELATAFGLSETFGIGASDLILTTKKHYGGTGDAQHLNGADMAILGYAPARFDEYNRGVEREYLAVYPKQQYFAGRVAWISNLLEEHPDRLFDSDYFEERYGRTARANLSRLLQHLRSL